MVLKALVTTVLGGLLLVMAQVAAAQQGATVIRSPGTATTDTTINKTLNLQQGVVETDVDVTLDVGQDFQVECQEAEFDVLGVPLVSRGQIRRPLGLLIEDCQ